MSGRTYSPQQKADALEKLAANGGDVTALCHETGIPQRTLYRWREELWQTWRRHTPLPPSPSSPPAFDDDLDALTYLRQQIMNELLNVAASFKDTLAYTTPSQRVNLLSQLLDRLMKLDDRLKPYQPQEQVKFGPSWDGGLYIRADERYYGPYSPKELPARWEEEFGEDARLEMYWGDGTFTILPEGELRTGLSQYSNFADDPCRLAENDDNEWGYHYG